MYNLETVTPFVVAVHLLNIKECLVADPKSKAQYDNVVSNVYKLKDDSGGRTVSNSGGWQSKAIAGGLEWMSSIEKVVTDVATQLHHTHGVSHNARLSEYWFNVNRKRDFNLSHRHPFSTLSACLYLKTPKNCGKIVFERPLLSGVNDYSDFPDSPYSWSRYSFVPEEGMVVFFPSTISHYVEPNESDEERVSVAFNFALN